MSGEVLIVESDGGITIEQQTDIIEVEMMQSVLDITPDGSYWVRNGQNEITEYVSKTVKPEIDNYVDEFSKPSVDAFVENSIKPEILSYTDGLKPALQSYIDNAAEFASSAERGAVQAGLSATSANASAIDAFEQANVAKGYADSINPENLVNMDMIIGCILEAPNGVLVMDPYVGWVSRVGVQAGVKVSYPNGYDELGRAISLSKTHSYSISQVQIGNNKDIYIYSYYDNIRDLFGIKDIITNDYIVSTETPKSTSNVWFNPDDNMHYTYRGVTPPLYSDKDWRAINLSVIGTAQTDDTGKVINLKSYYPEKLISTGDRLQIIEWPLPGAKKTGNIFNNTITTTLQTYITPVSGWFRAWSIGSINVTLIVNQDYRFLIGRGAGGAEDVFFPVKRGDVVTISSTTPVGIGGSIFIEALGVR